MTVFAHTGHWLLSFAYAVPVLVLGVWIAVVAWRERRREGSSEDS